jgi:hypothetical protein
MVRQWSVIRAHFEPFLAPSVASHVGLHVARYHHSHDSEGRGWIAWDKEQIASFEYLTVQVRAYRLERELVELGKTPKDARSDAIRLMGAQGLYDVYAFFDAVEDYPGLSIDQALAAELPITRGLAMLDRRLGKRRLRHLMAAPDSSAFVRRLFELRCQAEGLVPAAV